MPVRVIYRFLLGALLGLSGSLVYAVDFDQITYGNQQISVEYQTSFNETERNTTHYWLQNVSRALLTIYGKLPQDHFCITIKRSSNSDSPVPWGQVIRSTPTTVLLVTNPDLGYDTLINDWTAFHELSHLFLPYRGYGDVWFSEGLATYYQNIIQARSGLFDETMLWNKITAGFERGRNQQQWEASNLTEISDNLKETRQYMRVYWSGVLYWLNTDIALRKQNKGTLDLALKQLKACCEKHSMSARDIAYKLDELMAVNVFVPLFNKYSKSFRIPDYQPVLTKLGVLQNNWPGNITLDNSAPLADIRKQIYGRQAHS
jgi:hypothetical protein